MESEPLSDSGGHRPGEMSAVVVEGVSRLAVEVGVLGEDVFVVAGDT